MKSFRFDELTTCPLVVDALYEGGSTGNIGSEVISKLLSTVPPEGGKPLTVGNAGGFRYRGSLPSPLIVVLTSNSGEPAWPDEIDPFTGQLTYFGDNKSPGALHDTARGGNRILADTFSRFETSSDAREELPVFLYFTKWSGYTQQFRGLAVPGGIGIGIDNQLSAIWRTKDGARFQNYRAKFTILDAPELSRQWLKDLLLGKNKLLNAPEAYKTWVKSGKYLPLISQNVVQVRTKDEQIPSDDLGKKLVQEIHSRFAEKDPYAFERIALAIWGLMSNLPMDAEVTRKSRDNGRDALGVVRIGPTRDPVRLDFALEAKCYAINNPVGVRDTSRLISRLRRHHFGVIVTTSYFGSDAYKEIRSDGHPVVLITSSDIAEVLQANGINDLSKLTAWIDSVIS